MKGSVVPDEGNQVKKTVKIKEDVLELSGKGLQNMNSLPKRHSICDLILDNNSITKIEKLDIFPKLTVLSMKSNRLVRMNGVNFGKNLVSVNLSNNGIVSMEGLCWLVHLEYLDLSKNNIKRIQNVSYCSKLKHMNLSENSITNISNLKNLTELKVLLLHGNSITTLERAGENLPEQIETLSFSGNGIADLNELCHLSCLFTLKNFSIQDNPCVMTTSSLPEFDFRPFVLSTLPSLLTLDDGDVTDDERKSAERLSQDENFSLFTFGYHLQLVLYLSKVTPLNDTDEVNKDHIDILDEFLQKRRTETDQKNTEITRNRADIKASDTLESSSYSVREYSENTQNGSRDSYDEDTETDTLCSESRFLPVYSPLKTSHEIDHHKEYQTSLSWETSPPRDDDDLSNMVDDPSNMSDDLPIMTEEEANKLINLAATIIQSRIRGFLVRRKFDFSKYKRIHIAASKIQALWRGYYFRCYSKQGLDFRREIRIRRLQKYISTLCLMMQRSEKQHEIEKQQMLEIITLLYEKFTQLTEKVEKLESSTKDGNEREINDESEKRSEKIVHPVFVPHPRLSSRNIGQTQNYENIASSEDTTNNSPEPPVSENVVYYVNNEKDSEDVNGSFEDVDSVNNDMTDQVSDDDIEYYVGDVEGDQLNFHFVKRNIMGNQDTLLEHEEWDERTDKVDNGDVEKDKIIDYEDCPQFAELDEDLVKSDEDDVGKSVDEVDEDPDKAIHGENESVNEYIKVYEMSETPVNDLTVDTQEEYACNDTMASDTSQLFTTGNVCELLITIQDDNNKEEDYENVQSIEEPNEDYKNGNDFKKLDEDQDDLDDKRTINDGVGDNDIAGQFNDEKLSGTNYEEDKLYDEDDDDKRKVKEQETETETDRGIESSESQFTEHEIKSEESNDTEYVVDHTDIENGNVRKDVEQDNYDDDDDVVEQVEDNQNESNAEISKINVKNSDEHSEQDLDIARDLVPDVDESTNHLVVQDTGLEEEIEQTDERLVNPVTDESLKDSLDPSRSSDNIIAIVVGDSEEPISSCQEMKHENIDHSSSDIERRDSAAINVEGNEVNVESNEVNVKVNQMDTTVIPQNVKESDSQSFGQDTITENTTVERTSPRLGKHASSLLSALKDEITGVSSQNVELEESQIPPPSSTAAFGGDASVITDNNTEKV